MHHDYIGPKYNTASPIVGKGGTGVRRKFFIVEEN